MLYYTNYHKRELVRILKRVITRYDLYLAYLDARRHKRTTKSQVIFELDELHNLDVLYEEIVSGNYNISASICFLIWDPKLREIFAADFRDRIVHHYLINNLYSKFKYNFINNTFSCLKGKGTSAAVLSLKRAMLRHPRGYVFKFDIKNFFMSINKELLNKRLQRFILEKSIFDNIEKTTVMSYLVDKIVLHCPEKNCQIRGNTGGWEVLVKEQKSLFSTKKGNGMAIGNLTSQFFANFYLDEFDHYMQSLYGDDYGRYVDDFYIVVENKFDVLDRVSNIVEKLEEVGLVLHQKKRYSQPVCHGCKFLGMVVKGKRVYIGNNTVNRAFKTIKSMKPKFENIVDFLRRVNSYLGFMKYKKTYKIRKKLMFTVDRKWWDYFEINKDFTKVTIKDEYSYLNKVS